MICTLTARRLKPGSYDDFMAAWRGRPDDPQAAEAVARWNPVYATRDVNDENVVVSFGFFQGSLDELRVRGDRGARGRVGGAPTYGAVANRSRSAGDVGSKSALSRAWISPRSTHSCSGLGLPQNQ